MTIDEAIKMADDTTVMSILLQVIMRIDDGTEKPDDKRIKKLATNELKVRGIITPLPKEG